MSLWVDTIYRWLNGLDHVYDCLAMALVLRDRAPEFFDDDDDDDDDLLWLDGWKIMF